MLNIQNKMIALSLAAVASLFIGCGSSDSGTTTSTTSSTITSTSIDGQLIDGYVEGVTYTCADGTTGTTDINGNFSCESLPVTFRVGGLKLGGVDTLPTDRHVFPQDLAGVDRNDTTNEQVVALAQLLQSLDTDSNPDNGITIDTNTSELLTSGDFNKEDLDAYLTEAHIEHTVSKDDAIAHLEKNQHQVQEIDDSNLPVNVTDSINTVKYDLDDATKNTLAYMGNEERLAYDVYNKLYSYYPDLMQLKNIPTNSEIQHIASVKALVTKYNIDGSALSVTDVNTSTLSPEADVNSVAGVYDIQKIQDLYDELIAKGVQSQQDALQVGCMVEVVDVTDLDEDIAIAQASNAQDVVDVFNFLRDGSYSHYWSFDQGLKNLGVENGCCSLGDPYCKTEAEYPNVENGQGQGDGSGDCQSDDNTTIGQGKGHGRQ